MDVKDSVKGKGEERIPCNVPYEGVPAALEEFDAVGLNGADGWLCVAVFAICDGDAS